MEKASFRVGLSFQPFTPFPHVEAQSALYTLLRSFGDFKISQHFVSEGKIIFMAEAGRLDRPGLSILELNGYSFDLMGVLDISTVTPDPPRPMPRPLVPSPAQVPGETALRKTGEESTTSGKASGEASADLCGEGAEGGGEAAVGRVLLISNFPKVKTAKTAFAILSGFPGLSKVIKMGGGKKILAEFDSLADSAQCFAYLKNGGSSAVLHAVYSKYQSLNVENHSSIKTIDLFEADARGRSKGILPSSRLAVAVNRSLINPFEVLGLIKSSKEKIKISENKMTLTEPSWIEAEEKGKIVTFRVETESVNEAIQLFTLLAEVRGVCISFVAPIQRSG